MYASAPAADGETPYATAGARMKLEKVTDEATIEKLKEAAIQNTEMFYEIVEVRPLG